MPRPHRCTPINSIAPTQKVERLVAISILLAMFGIHAARVFAAHDALASCKLIIPNNVHSAIESIHRLVQMLNSLEIPTGPLCFMLII
jgi:hypothetical protein